MNENNTNPTEGTANNFTSNTTNNVNNALLQTAKATASALRSQNTFFFLEIEKYCFILHKTMEKPYLNLHFKFHDFFPLNNEDMKILSFGFFSFQT